MFILNCYSGYNLIMFDLPSKNKIDKKKYRIFLKLIKSKGYIMFQKSIYYKYYYNLQNIIYDLNFIKGLINTDGQIVSIRLTKKAFDEIIYLKGNKLRSMSDLIIEY